MNNSLVQKAKHQHLNMLSALSPLIVIGCHRSGTSLVSGLLDKSGIAMGKVQSAHNEARFFVGLNRRIFASANAGWAEPMPLITQLTDPAFRANMLNLIRQKLGSRAFIQKYMGLKGYTNLLLRRHNMHWGWKDPRNTITLPFWLQIFPNARVLYIYRNGIDVANSLVVRERSREPTSREWSSRCLTMEGAFAVWVDYEEAASRVSHERFFAMSYEAFLEDPKFHLDQIQEVFDIKLDVEEDALNKINARRAYAFCEDDELRAFYQGVRNHPVLINLGYDALCEWSIPQS